eukprot:1140718-Amphidinium_carterae.1
MTTGTPRWSYNTSQALCEREAMRLSHMQAFVQFEQQALRNAHLRQPRHLKDHAYNLGDRVCFWREKL